MPSSDEKCDIDFERRISKNKEEKSKARKLEKQIWPVLRRKLRILKQNLLIILNVRRKVLH